MWPWLWRGLFARWWWWPLRGRGGGNGGGPSGLAMAVGRDPHRPGGTSSRPASAARCHRSSGCSPGAVVAVAAVAVAMAVTVVVAVAVAVVVVVAVAVAVVVAVAVAVAVARGCGRACGRTCLDIACITSLDSNVYKQCLFCIRCVLGCVRCISW